jgi:hypothetical protein
VNRATPASGLTDINPIIGGKILRSITMWDANEKIDYTNSKLNRFMEIYLPFTQLSQEPLTCEDPHAWTTSWQHQAYMLPLWPLWSPDIHPFMIAYSTCIAEAYFEVTYLAKAKLSISIHRGY